MPTPHEGLTHLREYNVKDSNVELIGTDIDHKVKFASAETEPAWKALNLSPPKLGLYIWRIENFQVVAWPKEAYGRFYDGDSFIVLNISKPDPNSDAVRFDIHFWLGKNTSQDEAGTAAYKTVELDEYLGTKATQFREVQSLESPTFLSLFPRMVIYAGGVASGFRHVETTETTISRLLQITSSGGGRSGIIISEVPAKAESLNEGDVFVLDRGNKLTAWQGRKSSPIEKAKAAQAIAALAGESDRRGKAETEVFSQDDSRSILFIQSLGGDVDTKIAPPSAESSVRRRRMASSASTAGEETDTGRPVRLFRLSDASGSLAFDLVKNGEKVELSDFKSEDVWIYDSGHSVFVWQGNNTSAKEKTMWLRVAEAYLRTLGGPSVPLAKCTEGAESPALLSVLGIA